jgi:hypothetical protein
VLVVDHDPKFTSEVFVKSMGLCLIVGSSYHKNTNAKVERANGVINDKLSTYAKMRKDDWDRQLPLAEFAINNADSVLGDCLTPFFMTTEHISASCIRHRGMIGTPASPLHTMSSGCVSWRRLCGSC